MTSEQKEYIEQQLRHAMDYTLAGYRNMFADGHMELSEIPSLSEFIDEVVQEIYEEFYEADWHGAYPTFKLPPDWIDSVPRNDIITLAVGIYWNHFANENNPLFLS